MRKIGIHYFLFILACVAMGWTIITNRVVWTDSRALYEAFIFSQIEACQVVRGDSVTMTKYVELTNSKWKSADTSDIKQLIAKVWQWNSEKACSDSLLIFETLSHGESMHNTYHIFDLKNQKKAYLTIDGSGLHTSSFETVKDASIYDTIITENFTEQTSTVHYPLNEIFVCFKTSKDQVISSVTFGQNNRSFEIMTRLLLNDKH
jgi:hypothetical protein